MRLNPKCMISYDSESSMKHNSPSLLITGNFDFSKWIEKYLCIFVKSKLLLFTEASFIINFNVFFYYSLIIIYTYLLFSKVKSSYSTFQKVSMTQIFEDAIVDYINSKDLNIDS